MARNNKALKESRIHHSQELVDAAYTLTRDQKRILWLFLADIEDSEKVGVKVNAEMGTLEFNLQAYESIYNVSPHEASRDVRDALSGFKDREVKLYLPEESSNTEMATDELPWLGKKSYRPKRGSYTVYFNPYLIPFLGNIKESVAPRFKTLEQLSNPLHVRMYTKLIESDALKQCELEVSWMIERYELPKTYSRYSNFKQKFLSPCIEKIRKLEGMGNLEYKELKNNPERKRAVSTIVFTW